MLSLVAAGENIFAPDEQILDGRLYRFNGDHYEQVEHAWHFVEQNSDWHFDTGLLNFTILTLFRNKISVAESSLTIGTEQMIGQHNEPEEIQMLLTSQLQCRNESDRPLIGHQFATNDGILNVLIKFR